MDPDDIGRTIASELGLDAEYDRIRDGTEDLRDTAHDSKYLGSAVNLSYLGEAALDRVVPDDIDKDAYASDLDDIRGMDNPKEMYEEQVSWWNSLIDDIEDAGGAVSPDVDGDVAPDYPGVSMNFSASVPEDARAGQVWQERDGSGWISRFLDLPSNLNESEEPSYSLSLRAGSRSELDAAVNDLDRIRLHVGRASPDDGGAAVGAGDDIFDDVYELSVEEVETVYREETGGGPFGGSREEYVAHFDGFDPVDGDAPVFDDGGIRVVQAEGVRETGERIDGMTSAPDFLEVDGWTQQEAYDQTEETAKETWANIENSYLFGGKQEKKGLREAARERRPDIGVRSRTRGAISELASDILGDSIYHGWLAK